MGLSRFLPEGQLPGGTGATVDPTVVTGVVGMARGSPRHPGHARTRTTTGRWQEVERLSGGGVPAATGWSGRGAGHDRTRAWPRRGPRRARHGGHAWPW